MRKVFNIIINLDTGIPEVVATVLNFNPEKPNIAENLPKHSIFDVTPSLFDLRYSFTSSILSSILRDLANNIDEAGQKEYLGIFEEDEH